MKVLTSAYFDGITTTVTDFSIHRELGKNGKGDLSNAEWKYQYSKKRPEQDPGTQRLNEIDKSKMDQVSDILTFLTHTMLTLEKRFQSYETFGEIFRETQTGLLESSLWERILPMIYRLIELLSDITGLSVNEIMDMILQDEEKAKIYSVW